MFSFYRFQLKLIHPRKIQYLKTRETRSWGRRAKQLIPKTLIQGTLDISSQKDRKKCWYAYAWIIIQFMTPSEWPKLLPKSFISGHFDMQDLSCMHYPPKAIPRPKPSSKTW